MITIAPPPAKPIVNLTTIKSKSSSFGLILTIILAIISSKIHSQALVECHTPDPPPTQQSSTPITCWENSNSGSSYDEFYIPNASDPVKTIKLNLHVMQRADGTDNFQANNPDHQAYLLGLENELNKLYGNIPPPLYGGSSQSPHIIDSRIRFSIENIYYHQDDLGFTNNGNLFNHYNYQNYGIDKCNSLNIFLAGRHEPSYSAPSGAGMGLLGENSNFITLYNLYSSWLKHPPGEFGSSFLGGEPWMTNPLIGHEIGHCLGLSHSFSSCSQFPDMDCPQTNQWCSPSTDPLCSNNMMGYSNQKLHLTPLQIGHIHEQLSGTWRKKILKSCEFDLGGSLSISTNETWEFAKVISGNIVVEAGATLNVMCNVSMPSGGKIIVKPSGTLIIDGGTITNTCCDKFWHGIIVEGNYYQNQQPNSNGTYFQGRLIMKNGATLKNAREGISTKGADGQFRTGGIIQATESNIINCRRAVEFLKYENFNSSNNQIPNRSYFKKCHFEWNDDHLINLDLDSQTALITLWGVHGVRFEGCTFESNGTVSNGIKRSRGIYGLDASIKVTDYCPLPLYECPNSIKSNFKGFHTAIELTGNGTVSSLIKNSNFDKNLLGISLKNSSNTTIIFNEFSVGGHPYELDTSNEILEHHTAIHACFSDPFTIEENSISADPNLLTQGTHGIVIQDSGGNSNKLYRNTITNINESIIAVGNNIEPNLHYGLKILCNNNTGNGNDIQVRALNSSYLENVGIDRNQDDGNYGQYPAGNTFSIPDSDPENFVHLSFSTDFFYEYRYNGNEGNQIPSYPYEVAVVNGNGHIDVINSSIANACPTNFPGESHTPGELTTKFTQGKLEFDDLLYNYYMLIDNGNTNQIISTILSAWPDDAWELRDELMSRSPYNSEEVLIEIASKNILPKAMLLEVLLANPDALQSGHVIRHVEYNLPNPLPKYMVDLLWLSRDGKTLRSNIEKSLRHSHSYMIESQIKLASIYLTDSLYYNIDTAKYWISQNNNYEGKYQQAAVYACQNNFLNAIAILDSVPKWYKLDYQFEIEIEETKNLYILINSLYSDYRDEMQMNENEKSELRRISLMDAGKASIQAEQILCFFYDECYEKIGIPKSNNNIFKPNKKEILTELKVKNLNVYPNPSDKYVTIEFNLPQKEKKQIIKIVDIQGREFET